MSSNKEYHLEGGSPKYPISLLCTSRQIHDEATSIMYGDNEFVFRIGCRAPIRCAWTGPQQSDTFRPSISPSNARKIRNCTFTLYRYGWGKDSTWMKNRIRDMAKVFGGEHRLQVLLIDFENSLSTPSTWQRSRFHNLPHPDEAIGSELAHIKRSQAEMLDPLKYMWRIRSVEITGLVTKDFALKLKTAMEAEEPTVMEAEELTIMEAPKAAKVGEAKGKVKRRAKKRKKQSEYYKYRKAYSWPG